MRARGAPLRRGLDHSALEAHAGAGRAEAAPASATLGAQQRFLAYAAHELRGEIALVRACAEVALADPGADAASLREMGECVVVACERQERLLAALLTISRSTRGLQRREPVELASTAAAVLRARDRHRLRSTARLDLARTSGDPHLVECLVANLIANAVRHNVPGGRFDIATYAAAGRAVLAISNTGPVIPAGEVARLFQPFQRLGSGAGAGGAGLGLAIVQSIADAHDATVSGRALPGGGLEIDVAFPALD